MSILTQYLKEGMETVIICPFFCLVLVSVAISHFIHYE